MSIKLVAYAVYGNNNFFIKFPDAVSCLKPDRSGYKGYKKHINLILQLFACSLELIFYRYYYNVTILEI